MSSINNDGKIQEPVKPVQDELADELDSILNQETTKLPGSAQSEAEAMMSQLENVTTFHPVHEFNAGTPVAHSVEQSVEEVNIQPEAKQGTVHETQGKRVQGKQGNVPSQPQALTRPTKPIPSLPTSESQEQEKTAMHTPISQPIPNIEPQKRERAAMKELFDPDGKIGAVAHNALHTQEKKEVTAEKPEQSTKLESTAHVIEQKTDTTETKEKTSFGAKITDFMKKHFPKLSNFKVSSSKENTRTDETKQPKEASKASNFLQGLKARFSSTSRAAKVANDTDSSSIGVTTEKASKVGKMKLGNPITFIKGKLLANAGRVKYTEIISPITVPIDTQVANLRNVLERFDTANNHELTLLEDYKELHTLGIFLRNFNIEIELLLNHENIEPSLKDDINRSDLRDTNIGQELLHAESADEMIEILATTATQIREILDTDSYEL